MPIGFKFTAVNAADGWGAKHLDLLIAAGAPPVVMAIGAAGPVWEAQEKMKRAGWPREKRRAAALVFRHADSDVPDYRADPRTAAEAQWAVHAAKWPGELDRDIVWFGITNEPAFLLGAADVAEPGPHRRRVEWNGGQFWDNSEWLAVHAAHLAMLARTVGVRLTLLGWSPGTPEPWQWRGPRMTELLALLRANPDTLALDVHEYSLRADTLDAPALIGRWQAIPRPWPTVFVTEFGWTLNDAPEAGAGVGQAEAAYRRWYARPEVRGLALWTLGKEGAAWGELGRKMNTYLEPLTARLLSADVPPLAGEPEPPPVTPPATAVNLLANAGWEEGHYHPDDANGYPIMALQVPNGWRVNWRETAGAAWPNPFGAALFMRPEMNRLPASKLAADEQIGLPQALILEGGHTLKLFKGGGALNATLITSVAAGSGPRQLKLTVPVFADLVKGYTPKPQKAKIWADDAARRDGLFRVRVGDRAVTAGRPEWAGVVAGSTAGGWLALAPGQWNTFVVNFDAPATAFDLKLDFILPFALPQNGVFLDALALTETAAPPVEPPPVIEPPAPPLGAPKILDISKWQGAIDPARMKAAGVDAVILRASYATAAGSRRDERVLAYAAALQAAGIPIAALYHYFHPARPWREQYEALAAVMRETGIGRAALDLEEKASGSVGTAAAAGAFMAQLAKEFPLYRHLVYTSLGYWRELTGSTAWGAAYELWIAAWTTAASPIVPAPWETWTLWQYTSEGDGPAHGVASARVDINRWNGTRAQLVAWLKAGATAPAPRPISEIIWEAATAEAVAWNPTFALHAAIVRDGYSPIPPERALQTGGSTYHYQRAMPPKAATPQRVYWCRAPNWGLIGVIEDGRPIDGIILPKPETPAPVVPAPAGLDMTEYLWGDDRVHVLAYQIGGRQGHQRLTTVARNGRFYQVKDSEFEELWADATAVYRGADTSPGEGKYYVPRRDALTYGAAWCPRFWQVGAVFERNALVTFYYKADCAKAAAPKEGYHRTWLRLAARHATWTSAGGVTLRDVVELHWLTERDGPPAETYFYARRTGTQPGGLVGWRNAGGNASWIVPGGEGQQPPVMEVIPCLK